MNIIIKLLIGVVAFLHLYFLWLEMFGWRSRGPKIFKNVPFKTFESSKALAANQGLYNGFLAAGLLWSLFIVDARWATNTAVFFLVCVVIAGVFGGLTVDKKIAALQALPAFLILIILLIL